MPDELHVMKTLVVGLGTSGTRICDLIAARIKWEYGSAEKIPWVKFLCLETDGNIAFENINSADFKALTINATEYAALSKFSAAYDESIKLSEWADKRTLESIPKKAVDAGVGNIRMIGRLSFLFKKNYDTVYKMVNERLNSLRSLSGPDAREKLGKLPDGSIPEIHFGSEKALRVFVVGTLCGGTCSGLASDFGFFMQSMTEEQERVVAFFTLPNPSLSVSEQDKANRFKKNAYSALVELNHYHLLSGVEKESIAFPGRPFDTTGQQPYDLPYLSMPRTSSAESLREMEGAIADRIFLNAFVPATDPQAETINESIIDREGHAHVFCAFGLATLEFPAQQVIEACSKRLALNAIRNWTNRALPDAMADARMRDLGLTWAQIRSQLLTLEGTNLETRLKDQEALIMESAKGSDSDLQRAIGQLRNAFSSSGVVDNSSPLRAGIIRQTASANIPSTAIAISNQLQTHVESNFLSFDEGPGRLRDALSKAQSRLEQLKTTSLKEVKPDSDRTDAAAAEVGKNRGNFFKKKQFTESIQALGRAVTQEIEARMDYEAVRAVVGFRDQAEAVTGVADRALKRIDPVMKRLDNLRTRLTDYQLKLEKDVNSLSSTLPNVNGVPLFNPDSREGTVQKSYQECLERENSDPTDGWEMAEKKQAAEVIRAMSGLPKALFPGADDDWLGQSYLIGSNVPSIPKSVQEPLIERASLTFRRLRTVNIVDRWRQWPNPNDEVQRAGEARSVFLDIDEAQVMRGGRKAVAKRAIALIPAGSHDDLKEQISGRAGIDNLKDCPDPYRVVMIEERFRFPLYAALDIVGGMNSLDMAKDSSFPTFHTRTDIFWTGLSSDEAEKTEEAEEIVVVSCLLGLLTMKGGHLVIPWNPRRPGDSAEKKIPFSLRGAARAIVYESYEIVNIATANPSGADIQDLKGITQVLKDRIAQRRQAARGETDSDINFIGEMTAAFTSGSCNPIPGWSAGAHASRLFERYCARDAGLYAAYVAEYPPDLALIQRMTKYQGQERPIGGKYEKDGLYCTVESCCGWIGSDEADSARNGWRCFINPQAHDYGKA